MSSVLLKQKLQTEIDLIPENKLADLYNFIHYFRLGTEKTLPNNKEKILSFAGCWKDMDNQTFETMFSEIATRRTEAFSARRHNESSLD
ncbi:MAG: hypothetical protein WAX77_16320 [Methylococcaceae bacterium]